MPEKKRQTYRLINPYIRGSVPVKIKATNPYNGTKKLYNSISSHFTNYVDKFYMTIQDVGTGKLYHSKIVENPQDDSHLIDYEIEVLENAFPEKVETSLLENFNTISQQRGGRKSRKSDSQNGGSVFDDSDSDSDSDSDVLKSHKSRKRLRRPIENFAYFAWPYYQLEMIGLTPMDYRNIFRTYSLPVFSLPNLPTYEVVCYTF